MAGSTGLEPAASAVTGRRSNQLNYDPELICRMMTSNLVPRFELSTSASKFETLLWAVQDSNL